MATRLLLVRHGETMWHAENRYAGSSEVALSSRGEQQAAALATFIRDLPAERYPVDLYCSPRERAVRTAAPVANQLNRQAHIVEDLREAHFGIAEGRTLDELRATNAQRVDKFIADPVANAFNGAERPEEVADRCIAALRRIAAENDDDSTVVVVAHNTLLRLGLCGLLGIPLSNYRIALPRMDNVAITEIKIDAKRASLVRFNEPTAPSRGTNIP